MAEAFRTLPLRQNLQSACCRTGWFRTDFYLQSRSILSKVRLHDEVIIADRCPNSLGIRFVCSGAESDGAYKPNAKRIRTTVSDDNFVMETVVLILLALGLYAPAQNQTVPKT